MTDTTNVQNVVSVDDRNGSHYWICDVYHTTGTATDILVPNSAVSGSQLTTDGSQGGDVQLTADDDGGDYLREITIASGVETGLIRLCIRFNGTAGMGSGHGDL